MATPDAAGTPVSPPAWAVGLEKLLTPPRLASYMIAMRGDKARALHLYHWNVYASAAFQEVLSYVEVVLRNAMDDQLQARLGGSADWWDTPGLLDSRDLDDLDKATGRVTKTPVTHGAVVAELNFGFWRYLLAGSREHTLWIPALQHAFPALSQPRRSLVAEPVGRLHDFRNRIAHHEPIHRADLQAKLNDCLFVLRAVDPHVATWVQSRCRVDGAISSKPS